MVTKASNSVLNLVNPPIDNMVLLSGTLNNVTIGANVPGAGFFSVLGATTATINGGNINSTVIGATTPAAAAFTTMAAGSVAISGGTIDNTIIGYYTPNIGKFSTLTATTANTTTTTAIDMSTTNLYAINGSIGSLALTAPLGVGYGGTGWQTIPRHYIITGGGGDQPLMSLVTNGFTLGLPLISNGDNAPSYQHLPPSSITGVIGVDHGGTGSSYLEPNWLLFGRGSEPVGLLSPGSTAGVPLVSNGSGTNPSFQQLNPNLVFNSVVDVAHGGTGRSYHGENTLLLGSGSDPIDIISPHADTGLPLISNGLASAAYWGNWIRVDHIYLRGAELNILVADIEYYIGLDGSDSYPGTEYAYAWRTLAHAYNTLVDHTNFGNFRVVLVMKNGAYEDGNTAFGANRGNWRIRSYSGNPLDVFVKATNFQQDGIHASGSANVEVKHIQVQSMQGYSLVSSGASQLILEDVHVAGTDQSTHIAAYDGGNVLIQTDPPHNQTPGHGYHVFGMGRCHLYADHGTITASQSADNITVSFGGGFNFQDGFAKCINGGFIRAVGAKYLDPGCTGPMYVVDTNGVIYTQGAVTTDSGYFPGHLAPQINNGGVAT